MFFCIVIAFDVLSFSNHARPIHQGTPHAIAESAPPCCNSRKALLLGGLLPNSLLLIQRLRPGSSTESVVTVAYGMVSSAMRILAM